MPAFSADGGWGVNVVGDGVPMLTTETEPGGRRAADRRNTGVAGCYCLWEDEAEAHSRAGLQACRVVADLIEHGAARCRIRRMFVSR